MDAAFIVIIKTDAQIRMCNEHLVEVASIG